MSNELTYEQHLDAAKEIMISTSGLAAIRYLRDELGLSLTTGKSLIDKWKSDTETRETMDLYRQAFKVKEETGCTPKQLVNENTRLHEEINRLNYEHDNWADQQTEGYRALASENKELREMVKMLADRIPSDNLTLAEEKKIEAIINK